MNKKISIFIVSFFVVLIAALAWWQFSYVREEDDLAKKIKVYHIGLLQMAPTVAENMDGFKEGMEELGFNEGLNVEYTYRDADGDLSVVNDYAEELTRLNPDMIFVNTSPATSAIKEATKGTNIPVVFSMVAAPLEAGFVESIKSSGNNLTGTSCDYIEIAPKRLALLKDIDPTIKKVLVFYRPEDKSGGPAAKAIMEKASDIGVEIVDVSITAKEDIKNYLDNLKEGDVDAIIDPGDSVVTAGLSEWGIEKAKELKIPLMMLSEEEARKGSLASFGVSYGDLGKQTSLIANKVLMGINPIDIPIERPRMFFFSINLNTAEEIGLEVPESILNQANLVID